MSEAASPRQYVRIGDLLISQQVITDEQLQQALAAQKSNGKRLGQTLIDLGMVEEKTLLEMLSRQLGIAYVDLQRYHYNPADVRLLSETVSRRYRVVALGERAGKVVVGMSDPSDIYAQDEVGRVLGKPIEVVSVLESELLNVLETAYSEQDQISALASELDEELSGTSFEFNDLIGNVSESDAPVARLLESVFEKALKTNASDIHIEPDEAVLRIRQRIDGVLHEQVMNEKRIAGALVVRLKLLAGLDISEKRLPQDGRFNLKLKGVSVDVRMSTMPVQWGESVVLRLLNRSGQILSLDSSGMPERMVERFRYFLQRPNGLILVTGPTGSGKTTTLYSGLAELNTADKKIITVEDPVEYRLPRVNQVQVNEKIGLDFSTVLRATLRQDPDILLVGEIRDRVSAEIALRSAMTGHLVLSTLHTNDASSSALRLTDMGVDPYLVAAALKVVVAQRLLRKLCDHCSTPQQPDANEQTLIDAVSAIRDVRGSNFRAPQGCSHCNNTGYSGRVGAFEWMEVTAPMAAALRQDDAEGFAKAVNESRAFRPLSVSAMTYAEQGQTSLAEVLRVSAQMNDDNPLDIDYGGV